MKWCTAMPWERRTRTIFAFIPRQCDDGMTHWLERVTIFEELRYDGPGTPLRWHERRATPAASAKKANDNTNGI